MYLERAGVGSLRPIKRIFLRLINFFHPAQLKMLLFQCMLPINCGFGGLFSSSRLQFACDIISLVSDSLVRDPGLLSVSAQRPLRGEFWTDVKIPSGKLDFQWTAIDQDNKRDSLYFIEESFWQREVMTFSPSTICVSWEYLTYFAHQLTFKIWYQRMFWQTRHILGGIKSTVKWKAGTVSEECKYLRSWLRFILNWGHFENRTVT